MVEVVEVGSRASHNTGDYCTQFDCMHTHTAKAHEIHENGFSCFKLFEGGHLTASDVLWRLWQLQT